MALFMCPKGHVSQSDERGFRLSVVYAGEAAGDTKETGPLCLICYLEWLESSFPAKMLISDKVGISDA